MLTTEDLAIASSAVKRYRPQKACNSIEKLDLKLDAWAIGKGDPGPGLTALSGTDVQLILDALRSMYGVGYSSDKRVATFQAKLSVILAVKNTR